ncbi:MAG: hypothetical protein ACFB0B_09225 [Thermonemataceae bacterium]
MKKRVKVSALLMVGMLISAATFAQSAEKIAGKWYAEEVDKSVIKIYKAKNGHWYGKIIESADEEKVDHLLLDKIVYDEDKEALTSTLKATNGMNVKATLTLVDAQTLKIVGRKMLMSKTFIWKKQAP